MSGGFLCGEPTLQGLISYRCPNKTWGLSTRHMKIQWSSRQPPELPLWPLCLSFSRFGATAFQPAIPLSTGMNLRRCKFELTFYSRVCSWLNPRHLGLALRTSFLSSSNPAMNSAVSLNRLRSSQLADLDSCSYPCMSVPNHATQSPCAPSLPGNLLFILGSPAESAVGTLCTPETLVGTSATAGILLLSFLSPTPTEPSVPGTGTVSHLCLLSTQLRVWCTGTQSVSRWTQNWVDEGG